MKRIKKTKLKKAEYCFASEKGNAMVLAIIVSVILFIVMLTGIILIRQQASLISGSREKSKVFGVAEAGLDAVIWRLERSKSIAADTTITGNTTQGDYSVLVEKPEEVEGNDFYYRITSTGTNTDTGVQKKIVQDVYYINMARSIYTYGGANGGGAITGNVNIVGPFYTNGDLTLSGSTSIDNLVGTTGNPLMVRGDLNLNSGSVNVGTTNSPMSVFVKGSISRPDQVHDLVSKRVPEVSLPEIIKTQFLDSAQGNNNSVYSGNLTLGDSENVAFGNFSYVGNGSSSAGALTIDGVVYIDGDLTLNKSNKPINYSHVQPAPANSTIFVNGKITIEGKNQIIPTGTYPDNSCLALVNEDRVGIDDDIYIDVSNGGYLKAFFYSGGRITIQKQIEINGTIMATWLQLNQVPDLVAPSESAENNFPTLFPGKDIAFLTTTNWREVKP